MGTPMAMPSEGAARVAQPFKDGETGHILHALVTLFRHGDRLPKQKVGAPCQIAELAPTLPTRSPPQVKLDTTDAEVLALFSMMRGPVTLEKELKLTAPADLAVRGTLLLALA
jgi:hypothetical protein